MQHSYDDIHFVQDFAEKIPLSEALSGTELSAVRSDRNGRILVLSDKGLLQIHNGVLVPDRLYRPLSDMHIKSIDTDHDQFIYLSNEAIFSNAWAGHFNLHHEISDVELFQMGNRKDFLLAGKSTLAYFDKGKCVDRWKTHHQIKQILFDQTFKRFFILSDHQIDCYAPGKETATIFKGDNLNCLELIPNIIIGTSDGYIELDAMSMRQRTSLNKKMPCTDIRCVKQIGDSVC